MQLRPALAAFVAVAALIGAEGVYAQVQRLFPQNALRGTLVMGDGQEVTVNGRPARLAPGARIRNQSNMIAMSGTLAGATLLVHYTLDNGDQLQDVWILTPQEAAKRPWPATKQQAEAWTFDASTQTWSRP